MAITNEQVEVLRAFLAGDFERHYHLAEQLKQTADADNYPLLVSAAFFEAVDRRFANGYSRADIVRFVADARKRFDQTGQDVDPIAAERLMLAVFEPESVEDLSDETVGGTQVVLLGALITAENLDEATLDEFISEAKKIADDWIAEREG